MLSVYTDQHRLRNAATELYGGQLVPPFESPERAEHVLARLRAVGLGPIVEPADFGLAPLERVHDRAYLTFLASCWDAWVAAGNRGEAIPWIWPSRSMPALLPGSGRPRPAPTQIDAQLGHYALAGETSISRGTWAAALASANVALTAQAAIHDGARAAFALCRPPGHHAATDQFGGYCFINNAALAAQQFLEQGAQRIAVLDVDFHHGNGTQQIFYARRDVLFLSLHGDPRQAFPFFLGYADETGTGAGSGYNQNYPLPPGTDYARWRSALDRALTRIRSFGPDAVVVSLGVDTFEKDPISFFRLGSDDFRRYGALIAGLSRPTLFVLEGGYAVEEIGVNVVNVLQGFEDAG